MIAPIFFVLIFAIIQLGIVFGAQNALVNGVRDAARRAATYRINEETYSDTALWVTICQSIEQRLRESVATYPATDAFSTRLKPTIAYEWEQSMSSGDWFLVAHVSATYDNELYVPLISSVLDAADANPTDGNLTLSATEQMRIENPALAPPATNPPAC